MKRVLFYFGLSLFVLSSCQKDTLNVSLRSVELMNSLTHKVDINIESNTSWSIQTNDNWITCTPLTGSGNQTIQISIRSRNMDEVARIGSITIVAGSKGNTAVNIPVTQLASSVGIINKPAKLNFSFAGGEEQLQVKSTGDWSFVIDGNKNARLEITPTDGSGDATVKVKCLAQNIRKDEDFILKLISGNKEEIINVSVAGLPNTSPSSPVLISPSNGESDVDIYQKTFTWSCSDPDGDLLTYKILLSTDQQNWITTDVGKETSIHSTDLTLAHHKTYYWRIEANDGNGKSNSVSLSAINTFSTDNPSYTMLDGEYMVYYHSPRAKSVKILFMGDGYVANEFLTDGKFEKDINDAIDAFFTIEPYKTYKDYFTIYTMANYSKERGVNRTDLNKKVNNAFGSTVAGSGTTSVSCDYDKVFQTAVTIPDINTSDLPQMHIVLLMNEDVYAGTCIMYSDGKSIGMSPVHRQSWSTQTQFANIVRHESGGHGWGRLADEYVNYQSTAPQSEITKLSQWQGYGAYLNVSSTSNITNVPWRDLVGVNGYSGVGAYEGAFYYRNGFWRSESTSCMINNMPYYAAWQRYLIVKRIMDVVGESFDIAKFISKDIQDYPAAPQESTTIPYKPFVPLGPPIMVEK